MSDKEDTNYLDKFGDVQIGSNTMSSTPAYSGDLSDLSDVEIESFELHKSNKVTENVNQVTANEAEQPVANTCASADDNLSSFDKICLQANEISNHAGIFKRKCKTLLNRAISNLNSSKNLRYFQKGSMVICGEFVFLARDKQLMLFKYMGNDNYVVVPDTVGGLPVTLIHETAFNKGRFVATTKLKNFFQTIKNDNVSLYTLEGIHYAIQGVQKLQLPVYLKMIPNYLFKHLVALDSVEIPESVTNIAPNAFKKSNIRKFIFSNPCVKNMSYVFLPDDAEIYVRPEDARCYEGVLT